MFEPDIYIYKCKLRRVIDGDTVVLDIDLGMDVWLKDQPVRLKGINAPEMDTDEGKSVKRLLELLLRSQVVIYARTHVNSKQDEQKGKYGRWLVEIYDVAGNSFNDWLVQEGHAVKYPG